MKNISLKLEEAIFRETEEILVRVKKPRNRYINEAIEFYNKVQRKQIIEEKLRIESGIVSTDSMSVLKDFEDIDYVS